MMNEYNPNNPQQPEQPSAQPQQDVPPQPEGQPQPDAQAQGQPQGQPQAEQTTASAPPPQPDPFSEDMKAFVEEVQRKHQLLREIAQRDDIPTEVSEALRRLADRPLVDSLAATVDNALSQSTGDTFRDTVRKHFSEPEAEPKANAFSRAASDAASRAQRVFDFDRFYRLDEGRMLSGVCSGLGDYFRIDPNIFRIGFVIMSIPWNPIFFIFIIAYVAMAILFPYKDVPAKA